MSNNSEAAIPVTASAARTKNKCSGRQLLRPISRCGRASAMQAPMSIDQTAVTQLISLVASFLDYGAWRRRADSLSSYAPKLCLLANENRRIAAVISFGAKNDNDPSGMTN